MSNSSDGKNAIAQVLRSIAEGIEDGYYEGASLDLRRPDREGEPITNHWGKVLPTRILTDVQVGTLILVHKPKEVAD